jgi:molybdopterin synthase catalytic subunit
MGDDHVAVFDGPIDMNRLVTKVGSPSAGAIATFLGVTRDNFDGMAIHDMIPEKPESILIALRV